MEEFPRHGADVYELQKCIVSLIIGVGTEAGNWLARQMATNDEVLKISIFKAYDIWQVDSTWKRKEFRFLDFQFFRHVPYRDTQEIRYDVVSFHFGWKPQSISWAMSVLALDFLLLFFLACDQSWLFDMLVVSIFQKWLEMIACQAIPPPLVTLLLGGEHHWFWQKKKVTLSSIETM